MTNEPVSVPEHDICILGAGPAGLAAALALARKDIPVTLIEKDFFPRDKICGDGLSGKCLSALKKIDPNLVLDLYHAERSHPSWGAKFVSPNGKAVKILFDDSYSGFPPGYVMRRMDFDQFMMKELRKHPNISIIEGTALKQIRQLEDGIQLENPGTGFRVKCRLLLFAAGYSPGMIEDLAPGFPLKDNLGLGIRAYFSGIKGIEPDNSIEIHFLKELLPCYLWIFPLPEGYANVGLALPAGEVSRKKIVLKELLFELIEKYPSLKERFADARQEGKVEAQRLPFFHGRVTLSGNGFMLLGDAARLIDPFTGEGISNALQSGILAAEVAAEAHAHKDFSGNQLLRYDQLIYDKLEKDLMLGMKLHDLGKNAALINLVIGKAARSRKMRGILRDILYGMNAMKELSKPMFYAKLMLGID